MEQNDFLSNVKRFLSQQNDICKRKTHDMDKSKNKIEVETLRTWMENNEPVFILDVRPASQREEWQIPGSH